MKKIQIVFFIVFFGLLLLAIGVVAYLITNMLSFETSQTVTSRFVYDDIDVEQELNTLEKEVIKTVLHNKIIIPDNPSCGFSEEISIVIDGKNTLCFARDGCHILFWKEKDRYIRLTDEEYKQLMDILGPYGFRFPCV